MQEQAPPDVGKADMHLSVLQIVRAGDNEPELQGQASMMTVRPKTMLFIVWMLRNDCSFETGPGIVRANRTDYINQPAPENTGNKQFALYI